MKTGVIRIFNFSFSLAFFCLTFALLSSFLSCVSFSNTQSTYVPPDFFGITPERSPLEKVDFEFIDDLNAVWIRELLRWTRVERGEGNWNFEHYDNFLEKAEAEGKKVIFTLGFDNPYMYDETSVPRAFTEREIPYFQNYVETVVRRYGTRVVYEIWNEPNVHFWHGTSQQFYATSKAAAERIREVNSEAIILAGSTFRIPKRFIEGMFISGAMENVDGFSAHPYAFTPKATIRQHNKLMRIFKKFGHDKPVWVTEVGYFTGPRPFFSTKRHPEYIVKTLSSLAARSNEIQNIVWYEMLHHFNKGDKKGRLNPLHHMGLLYENRENVSGADAFALTANNLADTVYHSNLPIREGIGKNITSLFFRKDDGNNILILWKNGSGKKNLHLAVPYINNLNLHDIHNRNISVIPSELKLTIRKEPVFITWKGGGTPMLFDLKRNSTIVCLGDSLTTGHGADIPGVDSFRKSYPALLQNKIKLRLVNAGADGNTASQGLARLENDVLSKNPHIVLIELGANDLLQRIPLAETENNLRNIINRLQNGTRKIFLVKFYTEAVARDMLESMDIPDYDAQSDLIKQYDEMYNSLARNYNIELIDDIWTGIWRKHMSDNIHPNAKGYELMADLLFTKLKPYLEANGFLK